MSALTYDGAVSRLKTAIKKDPQQEKQAACCVDTITAAIETNRLDELVERLWPVVKACMDDLRKKGG